MTSLHRARWISWLFLIATVLACAFFYGKTTTSFDAAGTQRTVLALIMGVAGVGSVFVFPRLKHSRSAWIAIMLPALLARLLLLPSAPGDDIYRYLWEGKLVELGVSPYAVPADHDSRIIYRDAHWEQMNHQDKLTAYPPLTLQIFATLNHIHNSARTYQITFLILDLFLIAILLALLKESGQPLRWAGFYSLSALAMIAFSAEAHFDILMSLPLVAALYAHQKKWIFTTGVLLGLAVGIKIMVVVAVPLILWHQRWNWKVWLGFALAFILPLIPFWTDLPQLGQGILAFGSSSSFNGPIYQIFQSLDSGHHHHANLIVAGLYTLVGLFAWLVAHRGNLIDALIIALGGLIILLPTVHFWYIMWVLPLITLRPRASWISLSVMGGLYFLVWTELNSGNLCGLPLWAGVLFWLPFFLFLIVENIGFTSKIRHLFSTTKPHPTQPPTIGVLIPIYNPGKDLTSCLLSLRQQTHPPHEILLVDGGSEDFIVDNLPKDSVPTSPAIKLIKSAKGRGLQIKNGVERMSCDWIIVLHADAQLPNNGIEQLLTCLHANPKVLGGCFGQRFDHGSPALLLIEVLNELRGTLAKTSFGDQAQFFHRTTVLEKQLLTGQPLMEDVEISDQLGKLGLMAYLGNEVTVGASKWRQQGFLHRFTLIVRFFFLYRLLFWRASSHREELSEKLVQEYYPPTKK